MNLARGRSLAAGLVLAILVAVVDQASKWAVLGIFGIGGPDGIAPPGRRLLSVADLVLVWNRGVSFGIGNYQGAWNTLFFTGLAGAIGVFLIWWLARARSVLTCAALGLILGGALGNVIDRLRFGAVEDFIYVHVGAFDWWPAFNVANSAVCVGAVLLAIDGLFLSREASVSRP